MSLEYEDLLIHKYSNLEYLENNDLLMDDPAFELLNKFANDEEMPHIIFFGTSGVGKKIIIQKLLKMLYGNAIYRLYKNSYDIEQPCGKKKKVDVIESPNHIIINPNKNNGDRMMIQTIVKEFTKKIKVCVYEETKKFKVVQIQNMDNLSFPSQTVLRRLIEKKSEFFRFLFWCKSISSVSDPIRSRCMLIHIKQKTNNQLKTWIKKICIVENINIDDTIISKIVKKSEKNIKSILLMLDLYKRKQTIDTSYDNIIQILLSEIYGTFDVKKIRDLIYDIIKNIPVTKLINDIFEISLLNVLDINNEKMLIDANMKYMNNIIKGRREIIHVENYFKYLNTHIKLHQ